MNYYKDDTKALTRIIKHLVFVFGCFIIALFIFGYLESLASIRPEFIDQVKMIKLGVFLLIVAAAVFSISRFAIKNPKVPIWPYEEIASVNDKKWPAVRFSPRCYGCKAQKENGIEYCLRCSGFNAEDHY
ncbi:MAG: hypothetical protein WC143_08455 [Eubacteriales bacterium]